MEYKNLIRQTFSYLILTIVLIFIPALASAQLGGIIIDDTLGTPREVLTGPAFAIDESKGVVVDNNLFHSFEEFNIITLPDSTIQSATFTNLADKPINNVISRVTGGFESEINGLLKRGVNLIGADFWFLNPNGFVIGPNASTLNIDGTVNFGTADYLLFASGERFTSNSVWPPVLSVASPLEFGFLGAPSGTITVDGSTIRGGASIYGGKHNN